MCTLAKLIVNEEKKENPDPINTPHGYRACDPSTTASEVTPARPIAKCNMSIVKYTLDYTFVCVAGKALEGLEAVYRIARNNCREFREVFFVNFAHFMS